MFSYRQQCSNAVALGLNDSVILPLIRYLQMHTDRKEIRWGCTVSSPPTAFDYRLRPEGAFLALMQWISSRSCDHASA